MAALLGLEVQEIQQLLAAEQPRYRARQIYEALYRERHADWSEILTLPVSLRRELAARHPLGLPAIERRYDSSDGTRRYLLRLQDGKTVETVLMPEELRQTVCVSTQIGCALGCRFCMTARMGFERNLTAGEIVGQVLVAARDSRVAADGERLNVVLMGQGEPLLNLASVLKATRILTDAGGVGISPRRITLSTAGIAPQIAELGREPVRPKLAISLNASTEETRRQLMPITRKYPLKELMEACRAYPLRPWERLSFEYVLLKGVNDSDADARRLVRLLANLKSKVNLIALNPGPEIPFEPPAPERLLAFQEIVRRAMPCFLRKPRGQDVYAACGQLRRMSADEQGLLPAE
ncbi:MAG: 23S rRNA (adenine(2503)-C(2))-methyltransferase RlmN [Bryobacteraceae bacterium]|jgi:23S rRNA (adenine2503-C2)-methyltransferase